MSGPLIAASILQSAMNIWGQNRAQKAAEREGGRNRRATRDEMLIELMMESARVESYNKWNKARAEFMAPGVRDSIGRQFDPLQAAAVRPGAEQMEGMGDLITRATESQVAQRYEIAKRQAAVTPEALAPPVTKPDDYMKENAPGRYQDIAGLQTFSAEPSVQRTGQRSLTTGGLDRVEAEMLNKRVIEGATPDEISKLLKHFRTPGVEGGK